MAASAGAPGTAVNEQRFCTVCGAPQQDAGGDCPMCRAKALRRPAVYDSTERRSLFSALGLYAALFAVSIVTLITLLITQSLLTFAGLSAVLVVFSAIVLLWAIPSWKLLLPPLSTMGPARWLFAAPIAAVFTYFLALVCVQLFSSLAGTQPQSYLEVFHQAHHGLPLATLYIAVQPAIIEELAFRGIIFGSLLRLLRPAETVIVSAAMFAILHLSPISFPHLFLLGLILGLLRLKSGSLYPGMLLHFTHNFLCVVIEQYGNIGHGH